MENQLTMFDFIRPETHIDKPIRLIELFAGYGSQALALEYLGVDFEHYRAVEFDKYAIASYNAIHGTDFPVMDVTKISGKDLGIINKPEFTYLLTYSFPCTDLSVAGQMKGMEEGSGTRSSLLWEVRRLLEETEELPQILLMENVTQVHSKKNMPHFQKWLDFLESKGYTSYMQDLNARDYGVSQNRNRTFLISFLGDYNYEFPKKIELKSVMKDYLEDEVEDKYYLTSEKAKKLIDTLILDGKILDKESRDKTRLNERTNERATVDLCLKKPRVIDRANCIKARYDDGISNLQADGSGVCEWSRLDS